MKTKDYLCSSSAFPGGGPNIISFSILLLWFSVVVFVAFHHEMWRDEAHCLYVALSADSLWQLPMAVKNEGHPVLWYLILWLGYNLTGTPLILQGVSIVIGCISVVLFSVFLPFQYGLRLYFFSLFYLYMNIP